VHSNFGVQIVGIERDGKSLLSPGPAESLESGDQLLVLGSPRQVSEMAFWLST
jgi:K+/H+ antiporter YhaU regulatory subunit KhtT